LEGDFFLEHEIGSFSFEHVMLLFNYLDDHIAWFNARVLISLTMEDVFLTIWGTLIYLDLKNLLFLSDFLSIAVFAFVLVIDNFTLTSAIFARSGSLSIHAWPNHLHDCLHAFSFATSARLNGTSLATLAIAF
jgi:hypothetical protein